MGAKYVNIRARNSTPPPAERVLIPLKGCVRRLPSRAAINRPLTMDSGRADGPASVPGG